MKKLFPLLALLAFVPALQAQNTYREITLPELMKKYQQDASNIVIVDVRSDGEYFDTLSRFKNGNIGRIKGVKHIEVGQLDKPESIKQLEPYKDKEIYLLCSHSYRSRNASNILTRNGFPHVNNVQGGMTEWYRRYEDLLPYRSSLETTVKYKNISSAELYEMMSKNNDFLLIGINIVPKTFFDSANQKILHLYPNFKKAVFFNESDSAKILGLAKKNGGKPIVLYNNLSQGAAEMADYLVSEGIPNVQYLVGGVNYYLEYAANKNLLKQTTASLKSGNTVQFITPVYFCEEMANKNNVTVIDLRQDSLFLKTSRGIKSDYKYVQSSQNFPAAKGAEEFARSYPDKKKPYLFISRNSSEGLEMADQLSKMGYSINWLLGGISRFDWYTINFEGLGCRDQLIRP